MEPTVVQVPPRKKRRFFVDDSPPSETSGDNEPWSSSKPDAFSYAWSQPQVTSSGTIGSEEVQVDSKQTEANTDPRGGIAAQNGTGSFDKSTFESFVGVQLDDASFERLRQAAGDNMERAVNMYFDGSWSKALPTQTASSSASVMTAFTACKPSPKEPKEPSPLNQASQLHKATLENMPDHRYVGAFGVSGWATRSGKDIIKIGEQVKIERTKIKAQVKPGTPARAVNAARQRTDIIVRFTNSKNEEIGRLPKDTANWVSTLMDQKICRFDGVCFFAPERIRVNDTVELQLRCSLLKSPFEQGGFSKPADDNRTTGVFEEKETSEEKNLRLRQVALIKLFDEIGLHPMSANSTTAKHKREGLLQAAEIAEHNEKENDKKPPSPPEDSTAAENEENADGQELEQDQLDSLYKKAQTFDFDMPEKEPADSFAMTLRRYQKQALHWMTSKEMDESSEQRDKSMHPLWEEYLWPVKDMDDRGLPTVSKQDSFYLNPYSGEISLDFPAQEQHCLGGILADEMGLGKTIEMLSLMHTHRSDMHPSSDAPPKSVVQLPRLPEKSSSVVFAPNTTLVVAPMSLLAQWESEAAKASKPGTLKTMMYYGTDKANNLQHLCCEANAINAPNLIITSYGIVLSEFNQVASRGGDRGSHGGLFSLDFFRVILDEAHLIKNRQSKTAKACYEIRSKHRWVLTGTPIVNRLEDLFSLVHFLRVEPWSNFSFWKTFITVPFESKDFIRALDVVQTVLEPLVLRRTKDMRTPSGEALVPLPPRIIDVEEIQLSQQEREVYDFIFTRAKRTFNATMAAGTLLKSYTTIFAQILRLRQSCCHPVLTRNKAIAAEEEEAAAAADVANGLADDMDLQELIERFTTDTGEEDITNKYGAHVLREIQAQEDQECPICSEEPMIDPVVTGCWHSACKKCLLGYIEHQKEKETLPLCFNCRAPINQRDLFEIVHHEHDTEPQTIFQNGPSSPSTSRISLRRIGNTSTSAKITALLTHLKLLRREHPGTKSVVFSQFTSFLDLIAAALAAERIPFLRFDGGMNQKARAAVLEQFSQPTPALRKSAGGYGVVMLLSLRAGGVGLNLTTAKRVFMMDPWWSFAVEAQAIDRVHRMGQDEEVKVVRFVVEGSIEGRMLRVQERKKFIASSLGMMSEEEKKMQRIEDIKDLLS